MVTHENHLCLEGVCPSQFFIFPGQTGTATSSPANTTASQSNMNIVNVMLWMQRNAYEPTTIKKVAKLLRHIQRYCTNQTNPETVKLFISKKTCSNGHKQNLIEAYALYIKSENKTWEQPFYQRYDKKRRAPKEQLLDFMINHFRLEMALKLSMLKDLGARPQELVWLRVKDIDLTSGIVSITGAKHTIGRDGKLKAKSLSLLKIYIQKKQLNANSRLFNITCDNFANDYRHYRNRLANDYNMPELKQICLYDFRRFMASKAYKLSRHNLIEVKQLLGHKHIEQTEHYISIFDEKDLKWIPIKATTDEEKAKCIEEDCDYISTEPDGSMWFRKPA
jgi:integrase